MPKKWFENLHMKEEEMTSEEEKNSLVSTFRKSFRESIRKSATGSKTQINN